MMNNSRPYEYQNIDEIRYQQVLLLDNQDELKIYLYGYEQSKLNNVIYNFLGIIFLGIPFLIFNAWPQLKTIKFKKCPLETASVLLVLDHYGKYTLETVKTDKLKVPNIGPYNLRYFLYQHTKYVWDIEDKVFSTLDNLIPPNTVDDYLNNTSGLFDVDYIDLYKLFGPNKISVKIKSYWKLFFDEVFNPFYIFQVFSVVLWCVDDYMIYAGCVVVLTLFSSITSLIQTRKQSEAVHDLVESSVCHQVKVVRQNLLFEINELNINPVELVPGDLIILPPNNFVMPCDAVLLTGECIVNESVLTGESVPVTKTALHSSNDVYSIGGLHRRQTLFSGTTLIQTRYYENDDVLARVVRTGFDTTKGALVKSILFPSPVGLKFYRDSLKFVFVLFTIAAFGMAYCLYVYNERHAQLRYIITRALDIITIVVPPALPAAMAMGTVYSQARLKKAGIFCISPPIIPVCGKIKLACFDKTGTLTHDSLDMKSLIPCDRSQFTDPVTDICYVDLKSKLVQAMACCHDLTRIDGVLQGDPLDLIMFEFTKWEFEEPGNDENARFDKLAPTTVIPGKMCSKQVLQSEDDDLYQIGIIRKFPFSSTLQCMSVVSRNLQEPCMTAFVKGAPEKIKSMCNRESLPNNFDTLLSEYTVQGFRVIAIAYKNLPRKFTWKESQKAKREVIECNLNFLGFLVMQNLLKEQTVPALRTLQMANIRTVMITGDNILTAIAVARDCDMVKRHEQISVMSVIDEDNEQAIPRLHVENDGLLYGDEKCHLAIDGKTWEILKQHYSDLIPSVLVRATIFARFQPDQKAQLIGQFQKIDYVVSMVGDGANDCGALKAAHVGVSLSQAEASVAAPFTSMVNDISCLIDLILEGRCALVTSFAIFKYMALYSLIQFITIIILYHHCSILGDFQFLFIDLVITTILAVTIGRQGPSKLLSAKRPIGSLVSAKNVIPLVLQIGSCAAVQLAALFFLFQQHWFKPIPDQDEEVVVSWENTVLFTVSCFQYITIAAVYSKGKPYRQPLYKNFWLLFSALVLTIFTAWIMMYPCKEVAKIMDIIYVHDREQTIFRCILIAFPVLHLFVAIFIESVLSDREWLKKIIRCLRRKTKPKNEYKRLQTARLDASMFNAQEQSYYVNIPIM